MESLQPFISDSIVSLNESLEIIKSLRPACPEEVISCFKCGKINLCNNFDLLEINIRDVLDDFYKK